MLQNLQNTKKYPSYSEAVPRFPTGAPTHNITTQKNIFAEAEEVGQVCGSAAKKSAVVEPEVNPRNPLHTGKGACKQGIHSGFETRHIHQQESKTGVSSGGSKGA